MYFKELKERLFKLDTACVCDANKKSRVMDPEIRPMNSGTKMLGIARTVEINGDFFTVVKALHDAEEDEVLVISTMGDKIAVAGELFTTEAQRKGLAGIVIDGGCRDAKQIRQIGFPVYARYVTPMAGTAQKILRSQIKINCGGVPVSPGEIIFGDDDGIVVLSEGEIREILDLAEGIQQKEEKVAKKMKENKSLIDMLNFFDHYEKISRNEESNLTFIV